MNKKLIQTIEAALILMSVIIIFLLLFDSMSNIINYNDSQSLSIGQILFLNASLYLGLLLIIGVLLFFIKRKAAQAEIKPVMQIINTAINNHKIISLFAVILILILLVTTLFVSIQETMLYFPNHSVSKESHLEEIDTYTKLSITSNDNTYSGWAKISDDLDKYTILFFGGNAEFTSNTFYYFDQTNWRGFEDYNFIMVDYPTFGLSTGELTEDNIKKMSLDVFDYIQDLDTINQNKIIVMGFSLGTGVASYVSANREFNKLILVAPYSSMLDIVNTRFPLFYGPLKSLVRHQYDTMSLVEEMNEEILLIASNDDDVINIKISQKLMNEIDVKETFIINDATHNEILSEQSVLDRINEFID